MAPNQFATTGNEPLIERVRRATIGRYDIYAELGSGGMATVFLALDLALDRKVAIKVLSPALASSADNVERFRREAKVAASLNHPNIIGILAVGDDPELAYFVMKYVEGRALDSVIRDGGAQSVAFTQTVIASAGKALHYAHTRGIVHRDVKPANFMLDQDGWLVVTDFGIAKVEDTTGLTVTGSVIGTPYYMSPEQFHGKPVTSAADQYALGVVAFELLTGKQPYTGDTVVEVMRGHLFDDVPAVRSVRPDVPEALDRCIARMLAKDPEQRFHTLEDAVRAFGSVSESQEMEVRTQIISLAKSGAMQQPRLSVPASPSPAVRPKPAARSSERAPAGRPARPGPSAEPPRRRWPVVALVLLLVAAGVGTAFLRPDLVPRVLGVGTDRAPSDAAGPPADGTVAGGPSTPDPGRSAAIADSLEREVARLRDDSLARAIEVARADSIAQAQAAQLARESSEREAARRREQARRDADARRAREAAAEPPPGTPERAVAGAREPSPARTDSTPAPSAARTDPVTAAPAPATPSAPGTLRIGSRIPLAVLYIGTDIRPIGERGLLTLSLPAGPVTLSIRAENCATWDTTFTVQPGQTHSVGYRPISC